MAILRLSIAAYRLCRAIGVDGVYSRFITANRGITAGSGFATSELRVLMLDLIRVVQARWANVVFTKVYVDDLTLSVSGQPQKVIRELAQAIDFAVHILEDSMRMLVSAKKSMVVASKPSIAQAVVEHTSNDRVSMARRAKLLGTDTVGGARRSTAGFRTSTC